MRRCLIACTRLGFATALAVLMTIACAPSGFTQQGQLPMPPGGFKPPPPPPVKPYQAVKVTPPKAFDDQSFVAFRKQLGDIAAKKDRAGLAKLVVAQNFFWVQDKDLADKRKSGIDNLAKAINLEAKDNSGWDVVTGFATEPTAAEMPQQKGVYCAPADPTIDSAALEALGKATGTDPSDWGYPLKDGIEVHAAAKMDSPVTEKLGLTLVRVLPDSGPPENPNDPMLLHIALPSRNTSYVDSQALSPLGGDQMCYVRDGGGWKIAGYLGGASQ
jgi:hypothetical protein